MSIKNKNLTQRRKGRRDAERRKRREIHGKHPKDFHRTIRTSESSMVLSFLASPQSL